MNRTGGRNAALAVALIFLSCIGVGAYSALLPWWLLYFYACASVFTFVAYAVDKSAARTNAWRTPEKSLHVLALCGGWPGALVAQQFLRHKSQKSSFRIVLWMTILANCTLLAAVLVRFGDSGVF